MKPEAFALLKQAESSWWYEARAKMVQNIIDRHPVHGSVLDLGCGFGGMQSYLKSYGTIFGIEPNTEAANICRSRGYQEVFSTIEQAAVFGMRYELIGAFDSLEHVPDDAGLLASLRPLLKAEGVLMINVPAYPRLWSKHDVEHEHYRRYTASMLRSVLEENGYRVAYIGYWNFFMFPLFAVSRLMGIGGETSMSSPFINRFFRFVLRIESKLIPKFRLPLGSSVIALAVLR